MKQLTKIWGDLLYPTEFIYSNSRQLIQLKIYRTGTYWNNSSDGKLLTRTWARLNAGQPLTTTYGYDIFGQLQKIDYSDSTPDITYTYNRLGLPLTVTDAAGTRTFTYNAQFALQKESISGIYTKELNRVYTTSGLKGSYSGLNIGTVNLYTYGYDQYNRLNQVTTAAGVFNYTFLANSDLIASMTRPNNASTNYTYETARDLLTKVANRSISTFQYNNDALGRRTSMNRSSSAITAADVLSYTYNSYSELAGASSNNNASYRYSYTYDPIGNRKTAGLAGTNWTYTANNLNQYTALNQADTVQNPTYDADGNMLTRDGWTQTWNAENRLIKAEKSTAKLEFAYDYMGRRIEKKVYNGSTLTSHIRFVYDGYKLIEELNGLNNNAVLRRYVWQPVMLDAPLTVFDTAANKTFFYHTDANKNVTDLTDSAGAIVAHYEYSPLGQLVKSSGAYVNTNVITWSSEYTDRDTSLIYYNFREYDPKLGRWLSRDPIDEKEEIGLYKFVNNNPINEHDNLGLFSCCSLFCQGNCHPAAYPYRHIRFYMIYKPGATPEKTDIDSIMNDATKFINLTDKIIVSVDDVLSTGMSWGKVNKILDLIPSISLNRGRQQGFSIFFIQEYQVCEEKRCLFFCKRFVWGRTENQIIREMHKGIDENYDVLYNTPK